MGIYKFIGEIIAMIILLILTHWYLATCCSDAYTHFLEFVFELYEKKS